MLLRMTRENKNKFEHNISLADVSFLSYLWILIDLPKANRSYIERTNVVKGFQVAFNRSLKQHSIRCFKGT